MKTDPWLLPPDGVIDTGAIMVAANGLRLVRLTSQERQMARAVILANGGTEETVRTRLGLPSLVEILDSTLTRATCCVSWGVPSQTHIGERFKWYSSCSRSSSSLSSFSSVAQCSRWSYRSSPGFGARSRVSNIVFSVAIGRRTNADRQADSKALN